MNDEPDKQAARRRLNAILDDIDAEIADEARKRTAARPQCETDLGQVLDVPFPWVIDIGPGTSRADREAIQAEQDRWTRLEREGR